MMTMATMVMTIYDNNWYDICNDKRYVPRSSYVLWANQDDDNDDDDDDDDGKTIIVL